MHPHMNGNCKFIAAALGKRRANFYVLREMLVHRNILMAAFTQMRLSSAAASSSHPMSRALCYAGTLIS